MAKITIAGDAIVITSSMKLEDIRTINKYRPKALTLMGGEDGKEPVFAIGLTDGEGSVNNVGISFNGETHGEQKLASVTILLEKGIENVKEYVADTFGSAITSLKKIEGQLPAVLEEIKKEKTDVLNNITVAQ